VTHEVLVWPESGIVSPESGDGSMTPPNSGIIFQISASIVLEFGLSESIDSRPLEHKGQLRRLKEGRLYLPSTEND
jgi:hypothetical protein